MRDFLDYAREILGYEICVVESDTPDTFEKIFGISFLAMDRETIHENRKSC